MAITPIIVETIEAIMSLGDWNFSMKNDSLSELTFYNDAGEVIEKPADFPSDSDINTRHKALQDKIDSGEYKSVQAAIASF